MVKNNKKVTKNRKKFYIIIGCYVAVFLITSFLTVATLSWFSSSTWQADFLYMGGPVYLYFSDDSGSDKTSGENKLVLETPPTWDLLYPGMNIKLEAKAVLQGASWSHPHPSGDDIIVVTTGAVLRAQILLAVTDTDGNTDTVNTNKIYSSIWEQLKYYATNDISNPGSWVFDELDLSEPTNNFFYYVEKDQTDDVSDMILTEIGGVDYNVSVGFVNQAVITIPPIEITNDFSDYTIKFIIVFHGLQAFLPYEEIDIGQPYQGDTTDRSPLVTTDDVGMGRPLTISNSRRVFTEAFSEIYG